MRHVWIYGGGGHAKVVIDIAERSQTTIAGVIDDDPQKWETSFLGYRIVGGFDTLF